ncbi:hypothetical protein COCVIDRAFT_43156 [Bipolaris victoriae FI3]|uniref:Uncharacterized protein n=1 Tax=Bipolaris victoriae (strain FI3) TaxID=930091 RepID=W7E9D3_BIPV3|nr:hypothetical protein COCVIDRAFT_43156 [Bipolaris victoriae FI3]
MLRIVLKVAKKHPPPDFTSIKRFDEEHFCTLTSSAESKIKIIEKWRSNIMPHLAWNDREPPSTDPLMASLRAEYYEGVAELLRPYLDILKYLDRIKRYALSNIVAFDRIGAVNDNAYKAFRSTSSGPVVIGNPVNMLYSEFIIGLMWLSQEDIDYLYYRTVDRLSNFRLTTRLLVQDL